MPRSQHIQQAHLVLQHLIELPLEILWDHNEPPNWLTQSRPGGLLVALVPPSMASSPDTRVPVNDRMS